jgi:uncharacterized membrane protein YgdD (TMEM256/DUF423 family)
MQKNTIVLFGAIFGFLGVALGAFGAHLLKNNLTVELMDTYRTGIFYQLIHSVVIVSVGFSGIQKYFKSVYFFIAGILLFSVSLYVYSVFNIKMFAMFAPFGGVSFMAGWIILIIYSVKKNG